jgi:hypothetical protein
MVRTASARMRGLGSWESCARWGKGEGAGEPRSRLSLVRGSGRRPAPGRVLRGARP